MHHTNKRGRKFHKIQFTIEASKKSLTKKSGKGSKGIEGSGGSRKKTHGKKDSGGGSRRPRTSDKVNGKGSMEESEN